MTVRHLDSGLSVDAITAEHPWFADYRNLTDVAWRSRREPERGIYMAESEKVIRRALDAGHQVQSMIISARWQEREAELIADVSRAGGEVYIGSPEQLEAITGFHVHRGAIAAVQRPELPSLDTILADARLIVILEDIVDHTNVGAIFRSVAALGADAVLVTPRCADPFYRRSVRVSMGAVFQVPWTRLQNWPADVTRLRDLGWTVAALTLTPTSIRLDEYRAEPGAKVALILGSEGPGVQLATEDVATLGLTIPMFADVDSLNVAAAAAVAIWQLRGQLSAGS